MSSSSSDTAPTRSPRTSRRQARGTSSTIDTARAGRRRAGLEAVPPDTRHVLMIGVDQPRTPEIVSRVVHDHVSAGGLLTSPRYRGRGHPLMFSTSVPPSLNHLRARARDRSRPAPMTSEAYYTAYQTYGARPGGLVRSTSDLIHEIRQALADNATDSAGGDAISRRAEAGTRAAFRRHPIADRGAWRDTVLELWRDADYREERYAALDLAGAKEYIDFRTFDRDFFIRKAIGWALRDLVRHRGVLRRTQPRRPQPAQPPKRSKTRRKSSTA